jgi:hypothetical protein
MPQGGGGEVGDTAVVEVGESFGARKLRLVDKPDPSAGVSFVAFGSQHLRQESLVREALLGRRGGQLVKLAADGGQLQRFRRGCDGGLGSRLGEPGQGRGHARAPASS